MFCTTSKFELVGPPCTLEVVDDQPNYGMSDYRVGRAWGRDEYEPVWCDSCEMYNCHCAESL